MKKPVIEALEPRILLETDYAVVIDKPAGLVVHPDGRSAGPTLCDWILSKWPHIAEVGEPLVMADGTEVARPGIVHRLDKETSGIMVIAKTQQAYRALKRQFMDRTTIKAYVAIACGTLSKERLAIHKPIGRNARDPRKQHAGRGTKGELREASTLFVTKARVPKDEITNKPFTVIEAFPKTGRMHQIRVHLRSLNHPIAGDRLYGGDSVAGLERLGLHARMLTVHLPAKAGVWKELDWGAASDEDVAAAMAGIERVTIQAPLPDDLRTALSQNRETAPLLAGNGGLW